MPLLAINLITQQIIAGLEQSQKTTMLVFIENQKNINTKFIKFILILEKIIKKVKNLGTHSFLLLI